MRRKGFGVTFGFLLIFIFLLLPMRGNTVTMSENNSPSINTLAMISASTAVEAVQVEPGRIDMRQLEDKALDTEEKILTLLTFNMRSANNQEGSVDLEQIILEIRETGAQIIGLQEVERMMPRSGYKDQARIIAEELDYYYYYGGNINILGVQYGNAFLSKYPILEAKNHKLPKELLEPRGLIEALIDVEGTPYHVYVTHLGLNAQERDRQISYISKFVADKEENVILMGDFNNRPDSPEMDNLDGRMVDSAAQLGLDGQYTYSYRNDSPNVRIDRIYTMDNIVLKGHESKVSAVSDHNRVITQILHKVNPKGGVNNILANTNN